MSLANDNRNWKGTQTPTYSYDRGAKPIAQPECNSPSQHQFQEESEYITVKNDRWNNETPVDWTNHREATAGMGQFGDRQFASNSQDIGSTGYGPNMGLNEIPYGTGAAFGTVEKVFVSVDRADRGSES